MVDPTLAPTVATGTGGAIGAGLPIGVLYTLTDADGGETLPVSPAVTITTPAGYLDPAGAPAAAVDYLAGTLLAATISYAITVGDGAGGQTVLGPAVQAVIDPGHANAEVALSGLTAITDAASGSDPAAVWFVWRQQGGGPWYLLGTGPAATDTFLDNGVAGNCTVDPPTVSSTLGTNTLKVTVPAGQPAAAVSFSIYASLDGSFDSPALLGNYPIADAGTIVTYTSLLPTDGSPPPVSTCYPGANQIDPSTDILNWTWKQTAADFVSLPAVGNTAGDARVTLDTLSVYVWSGSAWVLPPAGAPSGAAGGDLSGTFPNPGVAKLNGVAAASYAKLTAAQTLTNKRITKRVVSVTQSATPAINTDNMDVASITGLAQAITSMTTNLTGTPVDGDELLIRLTDNATGRAITWGAKFEASTVALPTTTVASALLAVSFIWNIATSKWRCVQVA